jgi:rhodanese-related sulfurtransferase
VIYCSDEACVASQAAYRLLVDRGFENVRRYAGGLSDWEDAGYPLEGEMVTEE